MKKTGFSGGLAMMMLSFLTSSLCSLTQAADTPEVSTESIDSSCMLHSGSAEIQLDFKRVINRYLYRYGLTPSRAFVLRLDECDSKALVGAKLRLTGSESTELPGLLTLQGIRAVNGIVIGLQSADGQPLPINGRAALNIGHMPGDMAIALQAYLEVEPSAQSARNVRLESYSATAFVALDYQ